MLNTLDKVKAYFSPRYALKASQFRAASNMIGNGEYRAATSGSHYRIEQIDTTDFQEIQDLQVLRATSNEKIKNNGFYSGTINCATDHVIGNGLKPKAAINRRALNVSEARIKQIEDAIDDYFASWAESTISDITGKHDFFLSQREAYETWKRDGDCFATLPLTNINARKILQINLISGEKIKGGGGGFIEGILASDNGLPLEYNIQLNSRTYKKVRAFSRGKRNVLHVFKRSRPKVVRGVPFLSTVMRDIEYIDDYMKSELGAAKLSAIFFGSITTTSQDSPFGNGNIDLLTGQQEQTHKNTVKENVITELRPGDKLEIHKDGRNNPNYEKFIMTSLQKVSAHTRIPSEILLAQFVSSYSASRAAMLQMAKFVGPERKIFINSFCKPIRDQVITWGVLSGDLNIPEFFENRTAILRAIWMGDPMGSVDPVKDVKAKVAAIDAHLVTREQSTLELGYGDFETNIEILKKEADMIKSLTEKESNGTD